MNDVSAEDPEAAGAAVSETPASDPFDRLIETSKGDRGAPFSTGNVELLSDLKRRDRHRYESVIAALKAAGVRVTQLEKLMWGSVALSGSGGSPLTWDEIDPWPESVDGAGLADEIVRLIKRHLILPPSTAEAIVLWAFFAHSLDVWQTAPRLGFLSPLKRCGKTTALSVLGALVPRPLPSSNISPAAIYRVIEKDSPTLLIDEADTFLKKNEELRGILNSGHNRSQAYVVRTVGDNHEPARFSTWAPIAIAMIGKLPETIADRTIIVPLRRKLRKEEVAHFRSDRVAAYDVLKRKITRWVADNAALLSQWDDEMPSQLHDRAADNWRPLFSIASALGEHWPETARSAALTMTSTDEEGSVSVLLLGDVRDLFDLNAAGRLKTEDILNYLHSMENRPWLDWRYGKPLTAAQLSRLLAPFGVSPGTIRFGPDSAKGYLREKFEDAFGRYLPAAVTPSQAADFHAFRSDGALTESKTVTDALAAKSHDPAECDGVTGQMPVYPEEPDLEIPEVLRRY